jgi:hypothetical protein
LITALPSGQFHFENAPRRAAWIFGKTAFCPKMIQNEIE